MKPSVEIIEPKLFAGAVADEIVASAREYISERGRCTLALAGGSTPGAIYRALSKPPRVEEVEWPSVVLYWGDERWVPHTDNASNFKMTQETLLSQIPSPGPKYFEVDTSLKTPADSAQAYTKTIREQEKLGANDIPTFDIVLLGIGEDGHTASIFPGSSLLRESESSIAEAVTHPEDGRERISLTPKALFSARKIFFIVKGDNKADIVRAVLESSESPEKYPARLFESAADRVTFFLDSGAGSKLSKSRG